MGLIAKALLIGALLIHPERVIRNVQNTWQRCDDTEDSAWIRMFRNARKYIA